MQVRMGNPLFTRIRSGVYMGVIVESGLWLCDPRRRALVALPG